MRSHSRVSRSIYLGIIAVVAAACTHNNRQNGNSKAPGTDVRRGSSARLSEREAIARAERFVVENGYTDVPAVLGSDQIFRETIDDDDPNKRLRARVNTLRRNACGIYFRNEWTKSDGWTVVFCYNIRPEDDGVITAEDVKDRGRAVVMELNGANLRMVHADIALGGPGFRKVGEQGATAP